MDYDRAQMLKITQIESPAQIEELFSSFDPQKQSWVVSDLRTKLEMQKILIERQGYFLEHTILRASDLWKLLLKRLKPDIRIVSKDFARSLVRSFIAQHADAFGINVTSEKSIFSYMTQLAPLALAADSDERLARWFEEHVDVSLRWQNWYLIAKTALRWMIFEKNVIVADWIPSYLQEVDGLEVAWNQDIFVDLVSEISNVEAELFHRLSHAQNIMVIEPYPKWRDEFQYLLQPYEYLRQQTNLVTRLGLFNEPKTTYLTLRLSGMLAEVKMACSEIRGWLDKGVSPSSIAVIAPDIESYWPALVAFFEQEGVPIQKDQTTKLQSIPILHQWISSLRAQTSRISAADLEVSFYGHSESQNLRYEEFASLFRSIYGDEDLYRNRDVYELYSKSISLEKNIDRDQFLSQTLKAWISLEQPTDILVHVLREIFQNATAKIEMPYREWLSYLENVLATKEVRVVSGDTEGIVVAPLMSAQSYKMPYKIFLGLNEETIKSSKTRSHILGSDLSRLAQDLGFYLEHPDYSYKEFQLRWLFDSPGELNIFSFGLADFSGGLLSPSNFWMSLSPSEELTEPKATRWDHLLHATEREVLKLRGRSTLEVELLTSRIEIDQGRKPLPTINLDTVPSLSASQIEKYLKCPFTFAAQKVFRLQDHPELDLDEDPRSKGTFAHALFETLSGSEFYSGVSDQTLNDILENIKERQGLLIADPRLWASMKRRYFNLARRFLRFESEWRRMFPDSKIIAAEKDFVFFFDPQNGNMFLDSRPGTLKFSGKIDRIDKHRENNQLVVVDYKSSASAYKNHSAWLQNIELQLLFYMWAIEKEVVSDINGNVVGAFYYSFKDFSRSKGLQIEEHSGSLFHPAGRKGVKATSDDKRELLDNFEKLLYQVIFEIQRGEFAPHPFDEKICQYCEWNGLCRAPHLN